MAVIIKILLVFILIIHPFGVVAQNNADDGISFTYENDVFRSTDRSYTNGVRFSWISGENNLPSFLEPIKDNLLDTTTDIFPFFPDGGKRRVSYAFGQSMFTPDNIRATTLQTTDRPYAGWLYGTMGLTSDTGEELDYLEITLGVVGPASLAEQTQDFVHEHITGSPIAQGWDAHQLDNEPGIAIVYEHKWRNLYEMEPFGLGVDIIPHAGLSLGNILTHVAGGATARVGFDLPSDYGPPRVRPAINGSDFFIPTKHVSGYLFAGTEARAVGRNIFLDGNTLGGSHGVDKEYLIGDLQFGAAMVYKSTRLAYTQVFRSREYETQSSGDRFGVLNLSIIF